MGATIGEQDAQAARKAAVCIFQFLNFHYIDRAASHPRGCFASHESRVTNHESRFF
jgi:hypothetical protein